MTINYQFGDVDAHGAMIRAQAGSLEAEHQAIISDVLTASDFWGGAGSAACQGFITQLACAGRATANAAMSGPISATATATVISTPVPQPSTSRSPSCARAAISRTGCCSAASELNAH